MNEKFGEKPVLASELNAVKTETLLLNRLTNSGYFDATVTHVIDTGRRSIAVTYRISPNVFTALATTATAATARW